MSVNLHVYSAYKQGPGTWVIPKKYLLSEEMETQLHQTGSVGHFPSFGDMKRRESGPGFGFQA